MDGTNRLLVKEDSSLVDVLIKLACERLTQKQKHILTFLSENDHFTATTLVRVISKELHCSRSAVWNNLNSLKRAGLVKSGKNQPVRLTAVSRVLGVLHE